MYLHAYISPSKIHFQTSPGWLRIRHVRLQFSKYWKNKKGQKGLCIMGTEHQIWIFYVPWLLLAHCTRLCRDSTQHKQWLGKWKILSTISFYELPHSISFLFKSLKDIRPPLKVQPALPASFLVCCPSVTCPVFALTQSDIRCCDPINKSHESPGLCCHTIVTDSSHCPMPHFFLIPVSPCSEDKCHCRFTPHQSSQETKRSVLGLCHGTNTQM